MFRNTPLASTPTFKIILGFGLCTLGGAMLYAYFRNRDDDEEEIKAQSNSNKDKTQKIQAKAKPQQKQKEVTVNLTISNENVPLIVGRSGANLSSIEEKTHTKIRLRDKNNTHKYCDITGYAEDVKEARSLLMQEIELAPIVKEEIFVPQSVCGKIVGRCGEAMQEICRISLAKVSVDMEGRNGGNDKRRITITGNRQQVNIARKLIEDKIEEDEELRRAVEEVEQRREPRRSPTNSLNSSIYSSQTSLSSHLPPREKLLAAKTDDKPMEVYVSAVASPAKFWVQLIGPQSKKLDDMVVEMTEYYNIAANHDLHQIHEPYVGQIVAAMFKYDYKWYRAEIVGILPDQYEQNEPLLDLYFVDYGDSEYVTTKEVLELRTDFLTLRFQAVECFLANVKSTVVNEPDTWDPQSIQGFEELTQVANWKKLISRVVTYKERPKAINGAVLNSAAREGSPIPGIELFDIAEGVETNIGHVLISLGYALPSDEMQHPRSPYSIATPEMSLSLNSLGPQSPPLPMSSTNGNATAEHMNSNNAEDAFLEQQLQHLQKNNNLHLNGDVTKEHHAPSKFGTEFFNGNFKMTAAATANGEHNMNGNLSR